jgi:hypothetical protein
MLGYINYYADGTTSKLCVSRKVADQTAKRISKPLLGDPRKAVWVVDHNYNGDIIKITAEPIVQPWERQP